MNDSDALAMWTVWTVYDHPRDFPTCYVARKWHVRERAESTATLMMAEHVDMLRAVFAARGFICFRRADADDRHIVETWF